MRATYYLAHSNESGWTQKGLREDVVKNHVVWKNRFSNDYLIMEKGTKNQLVHQVRELENIRLNYWEMMKIIMDLIENGVEVFSIYFQKENETTVELDDLLTMNKGKVMNEETRKHIEELLQEEGSNDNKIRDFDVLFTSKLVRIRFNNFSTIDVSPIFSQEKKVMEDVVFSFVATVLKCRYENPFPVFYEFVPLIEEEKVAHPLQHSYSILFYLFSRFEQETKDNVKISNEDWEQAKAYYLNEAKQFEDKWVYKK